MRAWRIVLVVASLVVAAGCEHDEAYGTPPSPPAAAANAEQQVIAQYLRFWEVGLPAAFAAGTERRRRAALASVTAEPELSLLLHNLAVLATSPERNYGRHVPLKQKARLSAGTALIAGCLDSTGTGKAERKTGERLTRGVRNNPVKVTMAAGADREWRVSAVVFTGGGSC